MRRLRDRIRRGGHHHRAPTQGTRTFRVAHRIWRWLAGGGHLVHARRRHDRSPRRSGSPCSCTRRDHPGLVGRLRTARGDGPRASAVARNVGLADHTIQLMPYYSQACRILGIPDLTAVSIDRFVSRRGFLIRTDDLDTVSLFWPRRPRRFRDLLEPAVQKDVGLKGYLYANVTQIVPEPSGRKVERVEIKTSSGRQHTVRPNTVVLACGGSRTLDCCWCQGAPPAWATTGTWSGGSSWTIPKGLPAS